MLPDDPRTTSVLTLAVDGVGAIVDRLDLRSPAARHPLQTIAQLPRVLRAEEARGLGDDQTLLDYAVEALNTAATSIGGALASHWNTLPLMIRFAAALAAIRPAGRPLSPLTDLAADGDPIATVAVADAELNRLLVVLPIGENLRWMACNGQDAELAEERHRQSAEQLGEQLPLDEAINLLAKIDTPPTGTFAPQCLATFARAVGRSAPSAEEVY